MTPIHRRAGAWISLAAVVLLVTCGLIHVVHDNDHLHAGSELCALCVAGATAAPEAARDRIDVPRTWAGNVATRVNDTPLPGSFTAHPTRAPPRLA